MRPAAAPAATRRARPTGASDQAIKRSSHQALAFVPESNGST
ncbi:hypothetical protein BURMUCGD1_3947 [Burkholderia multivorans CGD1]|nr:hypothetical protein BURMUCGD1_3947 [Burkholderia multivorans CGD1]